MTQFFRNYLWTFLAVGFFCIGLASIELAAAEAARPAVTYSTFAPGNLVPGGGLRQRSRRPGAALKSFRGIAQDLFKS